MRENGSTGLKIIKEDRRVYLEIKNEWTRMKDVIKQTKIERSKENK